MYFVSALRWALRSKINIIPQHSAVPIKGYAVAGSLGRVKKLKKTSMGAEKKTLPVETDVNKLLKYVCGTNIYKEGEDIEIKPDSEYPEWLWEIHTGRPKLIEELDPETKAYWRKVRKHGLNRNNALAATKKF